MPPKTQGIVTRSRELLVDALGGAEITRGEVCSALKINDAEIHRVIEGLNVLSQERQLLLAALLIERVPRLSSKAYAMRAQAIAAIAIAERSRPATNSYKESNA